MSACTNKRRHVCGAFSPGSVLASDPASALLFLISRVLTVLISWHAAMRDSGVNCAVLQSYPLFLCHWNHVTCSVPPTATSMTTSGCFQSLFAHLDQRKFFNCLKTHGACLLLDALCQIVLHCVSITLQVLVRGFLATCFSFSPQFIT